MAEKTDNKISIIIVDDEPLICELIKRSIEWEELNLKLVGVLHDGIAALEFIEQEKPDIAVIDIRIPEIDGMSIIQKAFEKELHTKFVVISGYKEFEYAKRAISLNVSNYLVKPINQKELNETLSKLCSEIKTNLTSTTLVNGLKTQLLTQKHVIYDSFFNMLVNDTFKYDNIDAVNKAFGLKLRSGSFLIFIVKIDIPFEERSQCNMIVDYIKQIFSEKNFNEYYEFGMYQQTETRLVFFCNFDNKYSDNIFKSIQAAALRSYKYIDAYNFCSIAIGISSISKNAFNLHKQYIEAFSTAEYRRCQPRSNVLQFSKDISLVPDPYPLSRETEIQIKNAIDRLEPALLSDAIQNAFNGIDKCQLSQCIFVISKAIIEYYFRCFENFGIISDENSSHLDKFLYWADNEVISLKIIVELKKILPDILAEYIDNYVSCDSKYVTVAKRYISENYARAVTLEEVAGAVNLNPEYFSKLFKNKTGKNFSAFLQEVRIHAATELFKTTQTSVKEVCQLVGYSDLHYFSNIFKKITGISPGMYRKLYMSADSFL